METFGEKIKIDGFSIEAMDVSEINEIINWLSNNKIIDLNIAEKGLVLTLHGQNACQEKISKVDRWISIKEGEKNKAWTDAALNKAAVAGHKVVKSREWFAQADSDYIEACNQVAIAKAAKKWLEDKASLFMGWQYAFKTFLRRDYSLEKLGNFQVNSNVSDVESNSDNDWAGDEKDVWK